MHFRRSVLLHWPAETAYLEKYPMKSANLIIHKAPTYMLIARTNKLIC